VTHMPLGRCQAEAAFKLPSFVQNLYSATKRSMFNIFKTADAGWLGIWTKSNPM
jgi:hypothetical protein